MNPPNEQTLTDGELDEAAANLRAFVTAYMLTPEFEILSIAACAEIQRGGLTDSKSLARALGLPVEFLSLAFEQHAAKYVADHGGLN